VQILDHTGLGVLLIAFAGGLLSFFSPCVAPLAPGYIGYLSGTVLQSKTGDSVETPNTRRRLPALTQASLLFVGGFSAAFIILGVLAGSFGGLIVAYRPVMETIAGIVMLAMGVFLLGLLPREWIVFLSRESRLHLQDSVVKRLGVTAPFALGVVFAAGWTPCIGPVLTGILVYAGASASVGQGALLLTIYSLGFAVPFLAIAFGLSAGARALDWVKKHGQVIQYVSGGLLVAVGLLYLAGQSSIFAVWAQRLGTPFLQ